jgi:hypothetical protein
MAERLSFGIGWLVAAFVRRRGVTVPPLTNPAAPWQTAPGSADIEHDDRSAGCCERVHSPTTDGSTSNA